MVKLSSTDPNGSGSTTLNVVERTLLIKPSSIDRQLPDMYNFSGEQLFFVEVPIEALGDLAIDMLEEGAGSMRRVMTLAKMERNIAAGGASHRVNPAYGVNTSEIVEYSFRTRGGDLMTVTPQADQYSFYSNRGVTKILGVVEMAGYIFDFVNILRFGASDEKDILPFPGPLGVLNLPIKYHLDELDRTMFEMDMRMLDKAKKEGQRAVANLVNKKIYWDYGFRELWVSDSMTQRIIDGEFNTMRELRTSMDMDESDPQNYILYREMWSGGSWISVIEAFYFEIE